MSEEPEIEGIEEEPDDCGPCYYDALVIGSFNICKRNTSGESSKCESLHDKYLMDEITLQQYLKGIEKLVRTDPMAVRTLREIQKVAKEDGVE